MKNKLNKQTTETRENAGEQVTICFNFAFDWLIEWREFSEPIREQCTSRITLHTQLKIALTLACMDSKITLLSLLPVRKKP